MASATRYFANPSDAEAFAKAVLIKSGLGEVDSDMMSKCLVQADVRGVDTHGLARLEQYIGRVTAGLVNAAPKLEISEKTPVVAHLDGDNGFGFVVATKGMQEAIKRAEIYGIGFVTVDHSNHFGMAATYVLQALEKGMISLVFTNSAKQMPPFGGKDTLLGISPFAAGAPSGKEVPYILDMAPSCNGHVGRRGVEALPEGKRLVSVTDKRGWNKESRTSEISSCYYGLHIGAITHYLIDSLYTSVVAKGKIRKAARRGETIPLGWALDKDGNPTTDANVALEGSMAPIGGPKGSGIAILMDVMAGVLTGAAFGGDVGDQYKEKRPQNVGHSFIAIKPDVFMSSEAFRSRMDTLAQRVHCVSPAPGFKEVLFPGEPEHRLSEVRKAEGIPYAEAEKTMFDYMAKQLNLPALALSETPLNS